MFEGFFLSKNLAVNTARSYRHSLAILGVNPLSTRAELLAALEGQTSLGVKITALKSYFGWLVVTGQRSDDPTAGLKLPRSNPSLGRGLNPEQYTALKRALKYDREVALIGLLFGSGLRASEVTALDWGDVEGGEVLIREAKHGSVGRVPVNADTEQALENLRRMDGPVFVSGSNRSRGQRLSYTGLSKLVRLIGARVGLDLNCHDGRHTFVTHLVESGLDAYLATALTRHKDIRAYNVYAHRVRYQKAVIEFRKL